VGYQSIIVKKPLSVTWLPRVEEHDYTSAKSYLRLIFSSKEVAKIIGQLKRSNIEAFKAKDLFRASSLSLLGVSNLHVLKDTKKIKQSVALSPLLIVADTKNHKLIIADGYHRLCAVYAFSEDAWIQCKIVNV